MTSRKSFQNNFGYTYRSGLREGFLLSLLLMVVPLYITCFTAASTFLGTHYDPQTGMPVVIDFTKEYSYLFFDKEAFIILVLIAALLISGVVMAVSMFRFITNKKTVNVYYSLGITRAKLFSAKYLSGLTLLLLITSLPIILSLIINISAIGVNRYMITAFFYILLGCFSIAAFSFSAASAVISCVGTMFEGVLFSAVVILFPEIFLRSIQVFIEGLVFGTPLGKSFSDLSYYNAQSLSVHEDLFAKLTQINPLRYMQSGFISYGSALPDGKLSGKSETINWVSPDFLIPIVWVLISAAVFALGVYLFRRRKAEIAGFIGSNKPLNFVMSFIVATFVFSLIFQLVWEYELPNYLGILIGFAAFVVVYCIINLILLRDMRAFVKDLRGLPIQAAMLAVLLIFFGTGYFGAANRIPKTEDIASAEITIPYFNEYTAHSMYVYSYSSNGLYDSTNSPRGNYTTEKDINFVRSVHELIIKTGRVNASYLDDSFNEVYPRTIKITYKLKNGKEINRSYFGATKEVLDALVECDNTDYRKTMLKKVFKDPVGENPIKKIPKNADPNEYPEYREFAFISEIRSEESEICLYNKTLSNEIRIDLNKEQREKLFDCLYLDLLELSPENHYNPAETLGVISFYNENIKNQGMSGNMPMMPEEYEEDTSYNGESLNSSDTKFVITPEMKRTVELIKSLGYYDDMTAEKEIVKANIVMVKDAARLYGNDNTVVRYDASIESQAESMKEKPNSTMFRIDDKNKIKTVTDINAVKEMYPSAVTRGKVLPNDYIVELVFSDGFHSFVLVHENKMPESILKLLK